MGWTVPASNPSVGEIFRTRPGPGVHPASYTIGTGSLPEVKRPGHGVNHPPPSKAEFKEREKLHTYSPCVPSWHVIGWTFFTSFATSSVCPAHINFFCRSVRPLITHELGRMVVSRTLIQSLSQFMACVSVMNIWSRSRVCSSSVI
jgi:hypothetical protein